MSFLWNWCSSVSATSLFLCGRPEWAALSAGMGRMPLANHPRSLCPLGDGKYRGKIKSERIDSGGLIFVKWTSRRGKIENSEGKREKMSLS